MTHEELKTRFSYHTPTPEKVAKYEKLRSAYWELAKLVVELTPESREQSEAITNLETSQFYANAAIARRS